MITEWQVGVIATHEHVKQLHKYEPGFVTRFAGEKIRIRENSECTEAMRPQQELLLGCHGQTIEVHPEDGARLWPEDFERVGAIALCTCSVLTD